eukprot:jgi/Botrbrau1/13060/Bobra.0187s0022.1
MQIAATAKHSDNTNASAAPSPSATQPLQRDLVPTWDSRLPHCMSGLDAVSPTSTLSRDSHVSNALPSLSVPFGRPSPIPALSNMFPEIRFT